MGPSLFSRYLIICNPFNAVYNGPGTRYIAPIVVGSVVYNLNKFFEVAVAYEVLPSEDDPSVNVTRAKVAITGLRDNPDYTKAVIILNFFFMVVAPLVLLSFCHFKTLR